jgi:hypothetical protein
MEPDKAYQLITLLIDVDAEYHAHTILSQVAKIFVQPDQFKKQVHSEYFSIVVPFQLFKL